MVRWRVWSRNASGSVTKKHVCHAAQPASLPDQLRADVWLSTFESAQWRNGSQPPGRRHRPTPQSQAERLVPEAMVSTSGNVGCRSVISNTGQGGMLQWRCGPMVICNELPRYSGFSVLPEHNGYEDKNKQNLLWERKCINTDLCKWPFY